MRRRHIRLTRLQKGPQVRLHSARLYSEAMLLRIAIASEPGAGRVTGRQLTSASSTAPVSCMDDSSSGARVLGAKPQLSAHTKSVSCMSTISRGHCGYPVLPECKLMQQLVVCGDPIRDMSPDPVVPSALSVLLCRLQPEPPCWPLSAILILHPCLANMAD